MSESTIEKRDMLNDPIWEYLLGTKLAEYLPSVRRWWGEYDKMQISSTGVLEIKYPDMKVPNGLYMRMTSTPVRSPIKNVQAFPFVPVQFLNIYGVPGGLNRMVERVCKHFSVDEFTIIEKHNLPSTYHRGMIVCFIPTEVLNNVKKLGKYVYLTLPELKTLANNKLSKSVAHKCAQYLN